MELVQTYGGVVVPMVSPFKNDYSVDTGSVERIINHFMTSMVKPFVLGTTGEGVSMSARQKHDLVKSTVSAVNGKQPVLAGISGNSLITSVEEGKLFAGLGVSALVAALPNYYPVSDAQILSYFEKLADSVSVPLFLYNMPATVHRSLPLEVVDRLSHHPGIIGMKDSDKDHDRMDEALEMWRERDDFIYLAGCAALSAYGLLNGAAGIVPGTGNLCPGLFRQLYDHASGGNSVMVYTLQKEADKIAGLFQKNRDMNKSLAALKVIMSELGLCGPQMLPPLTRLPEKEESDLRSEQDVLLLKREYGKWNN